MARPTLEDEVATVSSLCRRLGWGDVSPVLLKRAHHTTLLLSPHAVVARLQSVEQVGTAFHRAMTEIAAARYLADHRAPVLSPLADHAGPHVIAASVVTFWPYLPGLRAGAAAETTLAASTLAAVHRAFEGYDGNLPPYTLALDRCWNVLVDETALGALGQRDRGLLRRHYCRLRDEVEDVAGSWQPLHGDVHLGNLGVSNGLPLWLDFEDACLGPREYDIAGLPEETWSRFRDVDQALIRRCSDLRSVCVAVWCWRDVSRSPEVWEAAGFHFDRVRSLTP